MYWRPGASASPLRLRPVNYGGLELLERLVTGLLFRLAPGLVVALDHEAGSLPQRAVPLLVHDLDVHGELHQPARHIHRIADVIAGVSDRHIRLVSLDAPADDRIRLILACCAEAQPALDRVADGGIDFLGERRLRCPIVERQDRDGVNLRRKTAAGEAVARAKQADAKAEEDARDPTERLQETRSR